MKKLVLTCLALIGAAMITSGASAQTTTTHTNGDLYIGFRDSTGGSQDYLINIGQASQYTPDHPFTLSLGNFATDLSAVFGIDWFTRLDANGNNAIRWSVIGAITGLNPVGNDPAGTLYSSNRNGVTPFARSSLASQQGTGTLFQGMADFYNAQTSTANSNGLGVIQSISAFNAYRSFVPGGQQTGANTSFNRSAWTTAEGQVGQVMYLNRLAPGTGAGQNVGFFTLSGSSSSATIQFIPEPSTYAVLGASALLLVVGLARRHRRVAA